MSKKKVIKKTTTTIITEETITNERTQIICILDRSGSMSSIIDDARGGFNEFLKSQKKLKDEATFTVALFDDEYELLYDNIPVKDVEEITEEIWSPRGMTALNDAIGKTINDVKANHLKLKDEKPNKVIVCIVTDGQENSSREYKSETIKQLIGECEKDNWTFVYLAANQDAFSVGSTYGFSAGNTMNFNADTTGMKNVYATLTDSVTSYRSFSSTSGDFKTKADNLIGGDDVSDS
ncbi:MAG: vWA domain-containing protein [bacterium]